MMNYRRSLMILTCIAFLIACLGFQDMSPKLYASIEMRTSEFNQQAFVKQHGNSLSETDSDFWGTDNLHELIIGLPEGDLHVVGGGTGGGTIIASTPMSPDDKRTSASMIASISFSMSTDRFTAVEAIEFAKKKCPEIEKVIGQAKTSNGQNLVEEALKTKVADGVVICDFVRDDIDIVVSVTRVTNISLPGFSTDRFSVDGWVGRSLTK